VNRSARIPAIARNRGFLALWTAHSVSTLGDALTTLTLVLLITEKTHSIAAVGALTVVIAVPGIAIGLISGAYADRWDRRRTMVGSDVCRAVLLGVLALAAVGSPALPALYAIAFLQSAVGTLFNPARAALMQVIVPADEQMRANSLVQTTTVLGELAGTTLAGFLVAAQHTYWVAFAVDAATFALSAAAVATIRRPAPADASASASAEQQQSTRAAIADGLRAVRSSPVLRALLLLFAALTFALSPMAVLLTPYVVDTLHISASWIGPIQAGDTAGNILGGTLVALAARRVRAPSLATGGMVALAALIASIAWATTVPALMAAYFVFGLLTVAVQTGIGTLTQTQVDNALMGRFIGLMSIVPSTVSVLAMAFSGTLGAVLGVRNILLVCGAVLFTGTVLARRQLARAARRSEPDEPNGPDARDEPDEPPGAPARGAPAGA